MQSVTERRRTRGQGGFTLIELLVVIAILGVLAGVVVFAVGGIQDNSDQTSCEIEKRTLNTAFEAYRAQERTWPDADAELVPGFLQDLPKPARFTIAYGAAGGTDRPTVTVGADCSAFVNDF